MFHENSWAGAALKAAQDCLRGDERQLFGAQDCVSPNAMFAPVLATRNRQRIARTTRADTQ
jgi:hypothetical protein